MIASLACAMPSLTSSKFFNRFLRSHIWWVRPMSLRHNATYRVSSYYTCMTRLGLRKKSSVNSFGLRICQMPRCGEAERQRWRTMQCPSFSSGVCKEWFTELQAPRERCLRPHRLQSFMVIQEILKTIQTGLMRKCRDEQRVRVIHLLHC